MPDVNPRLDEVKCMSYECGILKDDIAWLWRICLQMFSSSAIEGLEGEKVVM